MRTPTVLTLVLAGGEGSRLEVLTERRAKPAMPFAGVYRLIDFPLSNCMHSELSEVWLVQQYQPYSIVDHVANGRPWDLDRTYGGLRILHPHTGDAKGGFHKGNADAILRNRPYIEEFDPDVLMVLSADHVYKLDYREVVARHQETGADVTMVTTEVDIDEASRFGVARVDGDRIVDYAYKPEEPASRTVTTEVFAFRPRALLDLLEELAAAKRDSPEADEETVEDLGDETLPALVRGGRAHALPMDGYWRDVGTVDSYWSSQIELATGSARIDLDERSWPIRSLGTERSPAWISSEARTSESLLGPGCAVEGSVVRSLIAPGVRVRPGAIVVDSVILHDAEIASGAEIRRAIVDRGARIGAEARVGDGEGMGASAEEITLVGMEAQVDDHATIDLGSRVPSASPTDRNGTRIPR
ncbi:MAG: glucose-1-phosphate adenylyltransferase family protein [Actinomycetota bacterium]